MENRLTSDAAKIWLENHDIKATEERINDLSEMFLQFYEICLDSYKKIK